MSLRGRRVLLIARDPGPARCVAALARRLALAGAHVRVFAKDYAASVFRSARLRWRPASSARALQGDIQSADLVVTGTSRGDRLEQSVWRECARSGVPSLAVLDSWVNYSLRFRRGAAWELPDRIALMDDLARRDMLAEGFDGRRLAVTGHAALGTAEASLRKRRLARARLARRFGEARFFVTFLGQPFRRSGAWRELGFDEADAAQGVARALSELPARLIVRLHPKNRLSDFPQGGAARALPDGWDDVLGADVVVGVNSAVLLDAVRFGVPTLAFEPRRLSRSSILVRRRVIPAARSAAALRGLLRRALMDASFRRGLALRRKEFLRSFGAGGLRRLERLCSALAGPGGAA